VKRSVSVIIPTTAEPCRRESLQRAIDSIRCQRHIAAELILVVNGSRYDPSLLEELRKLPLRLMRLSEASLPAAIRSGRHAVTTEYFAFLDDDDIYLPDALACRVDALESGDADFVVSNGISAAGNPLIPDIGAVESDPLRTLLVKNWLTSCGGLYRSATISGDFFKLLVKYYEWTVLAFHLLTAGKKVRFVDCLTFRVSDTGNSASKQISMESMLNAIAVAEYMFAHVPTDVRAGLSWKLAAVYHDTSAHCLLSGRLSQAWQMHVSSMLKGGWQYFSYTRHLVRRSCAEWFGA